MERVKLALTWIWQVLRYWKPVRTFWLTAAGLLTSSYVGIESGAFGVTDIDWLAVTSASVTTAIVNFVVLMAGGDSFWSEPKESKEEVTDAEQ